MHDKGYQQFYRYTDMNWFDGFQSYIPNPELIDIATYDLPADWKHERKSNWYMVNSPDHKTTNQGWKIHLSATPLNGERLLGIVTKICVQQSISFKFQVDKHLLLMCSSKGWSREASGKFVTVYPNCEQKFKEVIEQFYEQLRGFAGPYILTDLRYKDSMCIYYRYGGIDGIRQLDITGDAKYYLKAPDGQLVPDIRTPYYNTPYWVKDPFGKEENPDDVSEISLKEGRYLINHAVNFSVVGGVYNALDLDTGNVVIIKEARPYTGGDENGVDGVQRLRQEYEILNIFNNTGIVPQVIDLFEDWEHTFLVQELIEGVDLGAFCVKENPLLRIYRNKNSNRHYVSKLVSIWNSLGQALRIFHTAGVVLGDFSIKNVLANTRTNNVKIIDFEAAITNEMSIQSNRIFTPGFTSPQRIYEGSQCKEDDYYSLGSIMLSMLFPISGILDLEPGSAATFSESYGKELGVPSEIINFITLSLSTCPEKRPAPDNLIEMIKIHLDDAI
ncbi:protein kinase [Paenibacillus sp. IB182496]|uniref:Protein kinase n=1 Tax=Paenibacillus sabuli TaxID=2772509 RepID=A0A927BV93_9BACL|nr:protein kinase [Paenibacillus sabuli]MBD2847467.1 protein kinase [Paenibacillus sabuli]